MPDNFMIPSKAQNVVQVFFCVANKQTNKPIKELINRQINAQWNEV